MRPGVPASFPRWARTGIQLVRLRLVPQGSNKLMQDTSISTVRCKRQTTDDEHHQQRNRTSRVPHSPDSTAHGQAGLEVKSETHTRRLWPAWSKKRAQHARASRQQPRKATQRARGWPVVCRRSAPVYACIYATGLIRGTSSAASARETRDCLLRFSFCERARAGSCHTW